MASSARIIAVAARWNFAGKPVGIVDVLIFVFI
jgi:hypothetical protein